MTKDQYFPLYWGDFLRSTSDWTGPERGLYLQMLASQWGSGSLRADIDKLAVGLGYTVEEFAPLWETVKRKFANGDGQLRNIRLEEHRQNLKSFQQSQTQKSAKGVAKRRQMGQIPGQPGVKPTVNPDVASSGSSRVDPGDNPPLHSTPLQDHSKSTPDSPDTSVVDGSAVGDNKPKKGSQARPRKRCPENFTITEELRTWAVTYAFNVNLETETATFMRHEFKVGKVDWPATWKNWMAREQKEVDRRRGKFGTAAATKYQAPKTQEEQLAAQRRDARDMQARGLPLYEIAMMLQITEAQTKSLLEEK